MKKRHPPQVTDHDLIVCLLAIDRILDFWSISWGRQMRPNEFGKSAAPQIAHVSADFNDRMSASSLDRGARVPLSSLFR